MVKEKVLYKAIVSFCISCSGGKKTEVRLCHIKDCALYPHRLGENSGGHKMTKKTGHRPVKDSINEELAVVRRPKPQTTGQAIHKQRTKRPQMPQNEKQGISSRPKGRKSQGGHAGRQGLKENGREAQLTI